MNKSTGLLLQENSLFLSYKALMTLGGISKKTIEGWNDVLKIYINGEAFIQYKSLSFRSKKKLLSETALRAMLKSNTNQQRVEAAVKKMEYAQFMLQTKYRAQYEDRKHLSTEKVTKFAQKHAAFQCVVDMQNDEGLPLCLAHEAWKQVYPSAWKTKQAFCIALSNAKKHGVFSVVYDTKSEGNNKHAEKNDRYDVHRFVLSALVSNPAKFSESQCLKLLSTYCEENKMPEVSSGWVKKWKRVLLKNPHLYEERYGKQELNKILPYTSNINPEFVHRRWEMDGKVIPLYGKDFQRMVLVIVIDSCSKKIVGYAVNETENSTVIMEALRDAVNKTGVIPFELVMDKHSWTQTKEFQNLKKLFDKKGSIINPTINPKEKVTVERYNQYLDSILQKEYGYIGKGIRSKSKEALIKAEAVTEYGKNHLSKDALIGKIVVTVETYNKNPLKPLGGKSPNDYHEEKANLNAIKIMDCEKAELLTNATPKKITAGQITFMRSQTKYEFVLPANLFQQHNGTTVNVRYDDLTDGIYLFDEKSGDFIVDLKLKDKIHTALVEQTEADSLLYFKHKGKIKGILSRAEKQLQSITERAMMKDPDAVHRVSALLTPKTILQHAEQDGNIRRALTDKGVNLDLIYEESKPIAAIIPALQPKEKRKDKALTAKNHTIGMVNTQTNFDND